TSRTRVRTPTPIATATPAPTSGPVTPPTDRPRCAASAVIAMRASATTATGPQRSGSRWRTRKKRGKTRNAPYGASTVVLIHRAVRRASQMRGARVLLDGVVVVADAAGALSDEAVVFVDEVAGRRPTVRTPSR